MAKDRNTDDWMNEPLMGYPGDHLGVLGLPLPKQPDHFATIMALLSAGPKMVPKTKQMARAVAAQGRGGDTEIAHLTPGEMVIPKRMQTPEVMAALTRAAGGAIDRYTVGHPRNRVNPKTGAPEFDDDSDKIGGGYADEGPTGGDGSDGEGADSGYGTVGDNTPIRVDPNSMDEITITAPPISGTGDLIPISASSTDQPTLPRPRPPSAREDAFKSAMKPVISGITNGVFNDAKLEDIYNQIRPTVGLGDAWTFSNLDASKSPLILSPDQMDGIKKHLDNLSNAYRDRAIAALQDARASGRIQCPKCK